MNSKQKNNPPKYAERLLLWFLREELAEEVAGDLEEKFYKTLDNQSPWSAKCNYWYQVANYLRPFALKKIHPNASIQFIMFQHYFKISSRNLLRQKLYSFLNIGGLAVGLTCFLLIFLFVQHEFSYDNYYENSDNIYRIVQRQRGNLYLGSEFYAVTPSPLAKVLKEEYPEVAEATAIQDLMGLLSVEEDYFEEYGIWADKHFFDVFPTSFLEGDPATAFDHTNSIILTQTLAEKIFGNKDPMGEAIIFNNRDAYLVTGIIPDIPQNVSLKFGYILNIDQNKDYLRQTWMNNSYYTFFTLSPQADVEALQEKMPALVKKYRVFDDPYPFEDEYFIYSLSEMHLQSHINFDIGLKGDTKYIYLFSAIAFIVLLLACINYINLAVARSIKRVREVGMRKVIGAHRIQLIEQFLGEAILIAFLAVLLAVGLTHLLLPLFGHLVERPIVLNYLDEIWLIPGLLLLIFIVGLISGSYPAFFMSALKPVNVLKGKVEKRMLGAGIQHMLIVGQYAVAMVLIASSLLIFQQLRYIQNKDLGYEKDYIITVRIRDNVLREKQETIKETWQSNPQIVSVSVSNHLPTYIRSSTIINDEEGGSPDDDLAIYQTRIDENYIDVYGMELMAGRNFSKDFSSDAKSGFILNETAAKALGWTPEEAIGKEFSYDGRATVIGVVKDFHMHSMHLEIQPLMMSRNTEFMNYFSVKVHPENLSETIAYLENSLKEFSPYPCEYQFIDESFDQMYKADVRMGETFGFFTLIAILIASLGLFGLAAFSAEQRTKEMGIRKVLGASVQQITGILVQKFLILVAIAFLVAIPIAWYVMSTWLQNFAYSVEIEGWIFVLTFVLALLIATLTLSYQAIKTALINPINSLRVE